MNIPEKINVWFNLSELLQKSLLDQDIQTGSLKQVIWLEGLLQLFRRKDAEPRRIKLRNEAGPNFLLTSWRTKTACELFFSLREQEKILDNEMFLKKKREAFRQNQKPPKLE